MPSITAVTCIAVLLAAVTQCAAKCSFTAKVGFAIDSKFSVRLSNVSSLQNCLLFLEQHASSFAAVAFNEGTLDCCTVPSTDDYKLIEIAGWSTYYIDSRRYSAAFTSSGKFTVPAKVTTLKVLAVGGGAVGGSSYGGGGGSGYVAFAVINVTQGQQYDVVVGAGGGPGGSGGGGGTNYDNSGTGGSAGSDGVKTNFSSPGKGQGSSFTSNFNQFHLSTLSAGSGAAGVAAYYDTYPGGGGGGGVLINGAGISSSNTNCYINGVWHGPGPASGYGAGGSGGCWYGMNNNDLYPKGGAGASGLVYIEYY